MVRRKRFSSFTRETVGYHQDWKCNGCHEVLEPSYHIDHITPLFAGGDNHTDNLQALCPKCHLDK